jgi:hypothetical protein
VCVCVCVCGGGFTGMWLVNTQRVGNVVRPSGGGGGGGGEREATQFDKSPLYLCVCGE